MWPSAGWLTRLPLRGTSLRWGGTMVVLGLFGLLLLLVAHLLGPASGLAPGPAPSALVQPSGGTPAGPTPGDPVRAAEAALEAKLAAVLAQIEGVGRVSVIVTLSASDRLAYAHQTQTTRQDSQERDASGTTRTTTQETSDDQLVLAQSDSGQAPILTQASMPEIQGVLVVAEGAADAAVRERVTRAVEVGLGVPAYRILVIVGKGK